MEFREIALYALLAAWCVLIFLTVPTGPNPYGPDERWHWAYQLFGGRRGGLMLAGIVAISFAYGVFMARSR